MQEIIEQIVDYLKGIWIKRRYLMIATWMICPVGWLVVTQLDNVYESEATVFADTQSILGPLLKGLTVSTDTEAQIQLMVKTLLGRDNLERISRMTDLDVTANTPLEYEELITDLKKDILIRKTGGRRQNIFRITYEHQDPEVAKNVVQSVLTVFIESMLGESRSDSDSAQRFLDSQIKDYENRLATSEAKLTDFKQKYSDVLPNQYGGYYQKLTIAKEQLKAIELSILETKTQLESARAQLPKMSDEANQAQNNIVSENTIQTTFDSRIEEMEAALDNLLLRYTEKHPDVIEVKNRLTLLTKQREKEIGVRKVLGASVRQLVLLLNSSFSKLVLLSFVLSVPIAYYLVDNWLENFSEKIEIGVMLFLIPAVITFGIATLTVSLQSFKSANANPVNSLRNE